MIRNRRALVASSDHAIALDCIETAIDAAAPDTVTRSNVALDGETFTVAGTEYDLSQYDDILLVGGGKAAGGVTRVVESLLGTQLSGGCIVTTQSVDTTTVRSVTGDHPLPSQRNVTATSELLDIIDTADDDTLVLFVLTGGASALLSAPAGDLTLDDLRETTERLLAEGVPIEEINAVRKHLSASKGGQLARRAAPATVVGLLLSDVVGNDRSTIGSGPTVPDETTFSDALAVLNRYEIDPPAPVRDHLESGVDQGTETPDTDDPVFETVENHLIGDTGTALAAARSVAAEAGYEPLILSSRLRGEARDVAKTLVAVGEEIAATGTPVEPPAVVLGGGECTVTVGTDGGEGGPNQELVLSGALELDGPGPVLAAVDTDGEDGSSAAAGAIADGSTVTDAVDARAQLAENDAGSYLSDIGASIHTGPTGTNVNDIIVLVVPQRA